MKIAEVIFQNGNGPYSYFIDPQLPGFKDDYDGSAVVEVSGSYRLVKIIDVIEEDQYKGTHPVTAEIVSLIDDRLYKQKKELKREQAKAREKLDKMLAKVEETAKYRMLLDSFPEAKDLIDLLSK